MRIALLNLPMDNNYGGNLQRYALMKILQDMGHDVTHISLLFTRRNLPYTKYPIILLKYFVKKFLCIKVPSLKQVLFPQKLYEEQLSVIIPFYEKYIKHTQRIYELDKLKRYCDFEAYIVGSDQVWRKNIAHKYLRTMFFDFLEESKNYKMIAYSASLGSDINELEDAEIHSLSSLYKRFYSVSVREDSALKLLEEYHWTNPKAEHTLDPTLLLEKEDYISIVDTAKTESSNGTMFCYILDMDENKQKFIDEFSEEKKMLPFYISINNKNKSVTIEQWLRSFMDAEFVVTDSYHGFLFSIIFNKPFYLFKNKTRGNSRFDSVCKMLQVDLKSEHQDWSIINRQKDYWKSKSIAFLYSSLKS